MEWVDERLHDLADTTSDYREFNTRILATVDPATVVGVRVPALRKLSRELWRSPDRDAFLAELPHAWYEEYLLHAYLVNRLPSTEDAITRLDALLPYVDNWSVCDALNPKALASLPVERLVSLARGWMASPHEYTRRFGVAIPFHYLLDSKFDPSQISLVVAADDGRYYVQMMAAWYLAEAMVAHEKDVMPWLEGNELSPGLRRKAIQKAIESYRIPDATKDHLRAIRRR